MSLVFACGLAGGLYWWAPWHHADAVASDSPQWHLDQARQALVKRDFEQARAHLRHCLEAWPFGAEIHYLMAQTCRRMNDYSAWEDFLTRARILQWNEDDIALEMRLHEAQAGDIWEVEDQLNAELDDAPPEQEVLIREALIKGYLENDMPRRAAELSHEWLTRSPSDWEGWLYRGRTYQQGTLFEKAIADFEKVLSLKPEEGHARLWLGETLLSMQQFEQAEDAYQTYLKQHEPDVGALWGLAKCQYQLGQHEAANQTLQQLAKIEPTNVPALLLRAKLIQASEPKKALALLEEAVKLRPNETDLLHNLILALQQLGQTAEADKYQRRLDARKPLVSELQKLRMQLVKESQNLDLRCDIAKLYLQLGNEEEAAHYFQTILFMDPNHRPTCLALADYWEDHGNTSKAAHYRHKAGAATATKPTPAAKPASTTSPGKP